MLGTHFCDDIFVACTAQDGTRWDMPAFVKIVVRLSTAHKWEWLVRHALSQLLDTR
jgi:hypothetical protein